jgi:hypothetical protein
VLSELGRFPIYFNIVKALVKYYYRLKNIQSDFPVLHDASGESKILSHSNKPSWYASINYIFKIIKTYKSGNNDNVHAGGKLVQNYFLHEWKQNLQAQANGKLCSYVLFKSNFGCEKYLSVINNIEIRKHFTRLRLSAHSLKVGIMLFLGIIEHVPDAQAMKLKWNYIFFLLAVLYIMREKV